MVSFMNWCLEREREPQVIENYYILNKIYCYIKSDILLAFLKKKLMLIKNKSKDSFVNLW